ncbi:hypothetical protein [Streptomyces sp. S.PNR 29]|uniref:hypothetical protein n=1 Tax=Streptomyces sp. S.PNR 29 TaxID=2973805 RepID=UPI0025B01C7B|nr:hypothetical protein [Streptomyces sp. S.PNR 29]MDN0198418.1 hypothetical protein [Streptomyces sp. S.PNR 29]
MEDLADPGDPAAPGESTAEVSPGTVPPGGSVTVSVSCDPTGGPAPESIDATSQAFEEGTVPLRRVEGGDDKVSGPAYRGTARIAPADDFQGEPDSTWTVDGTCPAAPGGEGKPWSATFTVSHGGGGKDGSCPEPDGTSCRGKEVPHGVRAGTGGAFTDSVPALVAGGLLIAAALGAAVHRLLRRETGGHG